MIERCPACGQAEDWKIPTECDLRFIKKGCVICGAPIYGEPEKSPRLSLLAVVRGLRPGNVRYRFRLLCELLRSHDG